MNIDLTVAGIVDKDPVEIDNTVKEVVPKDVITIENKTSSVVPKTKAELKISVAQNIVERL